MFDCRQFYLISVNRSVKYVLALTCIFILGFANEASAQRELNFDDVSRLIETAPLPFPNCTSVQGDWTNNYARYVVVQTWKHLDTEVPFAGHSPERFEFEGSTLPVQCEKDILSHIYSQYDQDAFSFSGLDAETEFSNGFRGGLNTNIHNVMAYIVSNIFAALPTTNPTPANPAPTQSTRRIQCNRDTSFNQLGFNPWICDCGSYAAAQCRQIMQTNGCDYDSTIAGGICVDDISGN